MGVSDHLFTKSFGEVVDREMCVFGKEVGPAGGEGFNSWEIFFFPDCSFCTFKEEMCIFLLMYMFLLMHVFTDVCGDIARNRNEMVKPSWRSVRTVEGSP